MPKHWKAAIADPTSSIAAIKKREPLIDEKVERARLELVIKDAIVTDRVRREGLSAVDPDRMKQTIEMVAKTFNLPALDAALDLPPGLPAAACGDAAAVMRKYRWLPDQRSAQRRDARQPLTVFYPTMSRLVGIEIVRQQLAAVPA